MKKHLLILITSSLLLACNTKNNTSIPKKANNDTKDTTANFFPVTSYLKGQILAIKNGGITPIKKITIGEKTDPSWLKMEDLETNFSEFLTPLIDSSNLKSSFTENKFLDETLNAFTFSYDKKINTQSTFPFTHWDVYVDAETNKVTRIYLQKNKDSLTTLQLTWQSGKWAKIVTIKTINGNSTIEKEEKTAWSFN
ncbi:MAG: hypothetical protein ABL929_04430 [Ferruginibacter sp.]|nr:hypothetical protein [Ferruginibacter sp.]